MSSSPREFKYIVVERIEALEAAILFPDYIEHNTVMPGVKVLGAGMCTIGIEDGKFSVACYGKSVSLDVQSRPKEDEEAILQMLLKPNLWS